MNVLYILLAIFIFGALIFIHELGHFLMARRCGVTVLEFAIGMGPRILSKKSAKSGTVYSLRLLPIGGFVSMLGEDGMEVAQGKQPDGEAPETTDPKQDDLLINSIEEPAEKEVSREETADGESDASSPALDEHAYCNQSVWKRILISLAGPAMNVILGFLLMFVYVLISGSGSVGTTQIAGFHVYYTGETAQLGFEPGDYLYAFKEGEEGIRIRSYDQLYQKALEAKGAPTDIYVQRTSEDGMSVSFVLLEDVPLNEELVKSIFAGSVSEKTGLKQEDVVKKVNGTRVHTYHELAYEVMNQGYRPVDLTVVRDGVEMTLEGVTFPNYTESGATFGNVDFLIYSEENFGILTVLKHTWFRSCSTVKMVYDSLFGLFTNRFGVEAVSGPIGITKTISAVAQQSMLNVLYLVVVISINLGIMNLLPFPGLDGGHLMIYAIEVVRRKPMKRELEGVINFVGLVILLALAALIMIKDILTL